MSTEIRCVAPVGDRCGEGAVWSAAEKAVYWTDINRFLVHRYDEAGASVRSWFFDEPVVGLSLTSESGRMLVMLASRLVWWWPASDRRQDHGFSLPGYPAVRLNDGRADPAGNLWVGSMKNNVLPDGEMGEGGPGQGILYRVAPDGTVSEWCNGLGISNTVAWSPDHATFYFGDTLRNCVWAFDYDKAAGAISNQRPHFTGCERGLPDGSAVDSAGTLWNCRFGGGCIARVGADGRLRDVVDLPVPNVTTCVFGGEDLRTLYVTSASIVSPPGYRLAGSLFSLRTEVPGLPENRVTIAV
ncbi:MAG: SMP-30/gluconolactonase/LRE family protein [Ancalomicrobiaceae bacterium]|nr:SMP-30/gluconolactonase/LRE family protein [Ancalomicrobiaceae bacterium]